MFKRVYFKRKSFIVVFFLVAMMFTSSVIAAALRTTSFEGIASGQAVIRDADLNIDDKAALDASLAFQSQYSSIGDDDKVLVMITADDNSLTKKYMNTNSVKYDSVSDYMKSDAGRAYSLNLEAKQESLKKKLGQKFDVDYQFSLTAIVNGFAAYVRYGDISDIEKFDGVESVIISEKYDSPKTYSTDDNGTVVDNKVNVYETGIYDTSKSGYDGEGTLVAVLDTGLDYTHPVFNPDKIKNPGNAKLDENGVAQAITGGLRAASISENLSAGDVYLNVKVPYGYDYADLDSEVFPVEDHGTHVAGIIAGYDKETIDQEQVIVGKDTVTGFTGVAPQAQLAIMKVFKDSGSAAETVYMLAAIEDCVYLNVDAVNMSLGMNAGFAREDDLKKTDEIYDMLIDAGINLFASAGNAYSSAFGSTYGLNLASNPDSGILGSPASYNSALAVASINGVKTPYMIANDSDPIYFTNAADTNGDNYDFVEQLLTNSDGTKMESRELEYVVIGGLGESSNYSAVDVKGKIALVKRGSIMFEEKVKVATLYQAAGIIIYNNVSGVIRMSIGNDKGEMAPACSIKMDAGAKLLAAAEANRQAGKPYRGTILLSREYLAGPFMSEFSSWGPLSNLELKPEITGHGGEILSSIIGGNYTQMSGTSMSAPNIAGLATLVRQHLNENLGNYIDNATSLTNKEKNQKIRELTNQLIMSTATIALSDMGNPYSPRRQGAGLANIGDAINAKAYIYIEGTDKTKISAKDDPAKTGKYELTFNVRNISNQELTYKLHTYTMTETLSSDLKTVAEEAYMLDDGSIVTVQRKSGTGTYSNNNFVLPAKSDSQFTVTVELSATQKAYLDKTFVNGMFVEGFISLEPLSDANGVTINVPWLAFYGDWTAAPLLDNAIYEVSRDELDDGLKDHEKIKAAVRAIQPYGMLHWKNNTNDQVVLPMGQNVWYVPDGYQSMPVENDKNALSLNTASMHQLFYVTGFLRNAKNVEVIITNAFTGQKMLHQNFNNARKSTGIMLTEGQLNLTTFISDSGLMFKEGNKYTFSFRGELDYENGDKVTNNEYSFDFYVDSTPPSIENAFLKVEKDNNRENPQYYMNFDIYDNHYAMALDIKVFDKNINTYKTIFRNSKENTNAMIPINSERGSTTRVSVNVTNYWDRIKDSNYEVLVSVYDYAFNYTEKYIDFSDYYNAIKKIEFTQTTIGRSLDIYEEYDLYDIMNIEGMSDGAPWDEDFVWRSDNPDIAGVIDGKVTGYGTGSTTIYVSSKKRPSVRATIKIDVSTTAYRGKTGITPNQVILNRTSMTLGEAAEYELVTKVLPLNSTVEYKIEWVSSNPSVASVRETSNGKAIATAVKEGTAYIYANLMIKDASGNFVSANRSAACRITVPKLYETSFKALVSYTGAYKNLVIPSDLGIDSIGQACFLDNNTLESITIPEGIKSIGYAAFAYCTNLKEVNLPASLQKIEPWAFAMKINSDGYLLHSIETVNINKINGNYNLRTIGYNAFYLNFLLKSIDLSQVATIGSAAFLLCNALTEVNLENLRYCGAEAFLMCANLSKVTFSEYAVIGAFAFSDCTMLTELTLPMQRIEPYAFFWSSSTSNSSLSAVTFTNSKPLSIGEAAFANNTNLVRVNFVGSPSSGSPTSGYVSVIGSAAFYYTGITTITLPAALETIGAEAFGSCYSLKTIIISEYTGPSAIQGVLFNGTNVSTIKVDGNNPYFSGNAGNTILFNKDKTEILLVAPAANLGTLNLSEMGVERIGDYAFATQTFLSGINLTGVKHIGEGAFNLCDSLTSIELPASLESIGEGVFAGCMNLASVTFASGFDLDHLAPFVFYRCTALSDIVLPDSITAIDYGLFGKCTALTTVTAANITDIDDWGFYGCSKLSTLDISSVTYIGQMAFYSCLVINNLDFSSVEAIDSYAFALCSGLEVSELPKAQYIGIFAFSGCSAITEISLDEVIGIGDYAFSGDCYARFEDTSGNASWAWVRSANNLASISMPKATYIGEGAFTGAAVVEVTLPATLGYLGEYAFEDCASLERYIMAENDLYFVDQGVLYQYVEYGYILINYPAAKKDEVYTVLDGTTRIGSGAVMNNKSLKEVTLPYELKVIGNYAFYGCSALKTFNFRSLYAPILEADLTMVELEKNVASNGDNTAYPISNTEVIYDHDYHFNYYAESHYTNFVYSFDDFYHTSLTSTLKMTYPSNGINYDKLLYVNYFGTAVQTAEVMNEFTMDLNTELAALPTSAAYTYSQHGAQIKAAWLRYLSVSSSQKGFVTGVSSLETLQTKFLNDYIATLPSIDNYTDSYRTAVSEGMDFYNSLSSTQKSAITDYKKLNDLYNFDGTGTDDPKDDPLSALTIGLIVGGCLAALAAAALVVFFVLRKKKIGAKKEKNE